MSTPNIFHRFSKHFRRILLLTQEVAASLHHQKIEPLHLLYCLSNERGSLGAEILHKNNLTPDKTRLALELASHLQSPSMTTTEANPPLSASSQQILEQAVKIAEGIVNFFNQQQVNLKEIKNHLTTILKSTARFSDTDHNLGWDQTEMEKIMAGGNNGNSKESALAFFATDLTAEEMQGQLDPLIGRDKEVDRLIQILCRRTKNNPILLGEPGVGKTALVEGLAKRIAEGNVPNILLNKRILNLDLGNVIAGTMYRGEMEGRLKQIIEEVKEDPDIILFIDEIHSVIGAGSASGSLDAANMFKPALAKGQLRLIGATTLTEYKKHIENDPAFERRFQPIMVNENSPEETIAIIKGLRKNYEKYHQVKITDEAVLAAVELSARYLPDRFLPDKAIDLIDEAAAKIKVQATTSNLIKDIKELEQQIKKIETNKEKFILADDFEQALKTRAQIEDLTAKLQTLQGQQDEEKKKIIGLLGRSEIAQLVSQMTGVPIQELIVSEKERLLNLERLMSQHIIGQDDALKAIAESLRRNRTGLGQPNRPIASFMFLGPTGVGKTETAKILAREIYENEKSLIRIDMSEFSESFNVSKLLGAPAGYVGYKEGNKFTDVVRRQPYSVLLFDEIEKAHPDVFNLLLPILEDGRISDATGRVINFTNTIIIMTSNIGLNEFNQHAALGFGARGLSKAGVDQKYEDDFAELSSKIKDGLKEEFRPEFLNRLDRVIIFKPLSIAAAEKITQLLIKEVAGRVQAKGYKLKISPEAVKWLVKEGFIPQEGARSLRRIIQDQVENILATILLNRSSKPGDTLQLGLKQNKLVVE
ncbi:MAG: ATP-dependent Clp protease ATP-binding subunit [Candidatus Komeilibacteria bacterium]|nr:ATP-dependent Clp protease ATP-binding subunit [Candidatus Komeilibacteria bacterium]